jgi:Permease family
LLFSPVLLSPAGEDSLALGFGLEYYLRRTNSSFTAEGILSRQYAESTREQAAHVAGCVKTRLPVGIGRARETCDLLYGVDETPPLFAMVVLAVQHVFVISVGWIFVVVFVTSIAGTPEQSQSIIRMAMIASGIATILQARTRGPVGSGYLCPFPAGRRISRLRSWQARPAAYRWYSVSRLAPGFLQGCSPASCSGYARCFLRR